MLPTLHAKRRNGSGAGTVLGSPIGVLKKFLIRPVVGLKQLFTWSRHNPSRPKIDITAAATTTNNGNITGSSRQQQRKSLSAPTPMMKTDPTSPQKVRGKVQFYEVSEHPGYWYETTSLPNHLAGARRQRLVILKPPSSTAVPDSSVPEMEIPPEWTEWNERAKATPEEEAKAWAEAQEMEKEMAWRPTAFVGGKAWEFLPGAREPTIQAPFLRSGRRAAMRIPSGELERIDVLGRRFVGDQEVRQVPSGSASTFGSRTRGNGHRHSASAPDFDPIPEEFYAEQDYSQPRRILQRHEEEVSSITSQRSKNKSTKSVRNRSPSSEKGKEKENSWGRTSPAGSIRISRPIIQQSSSRRPRTNSGGVQQRARSATVPMRSNSFNRQDSSYHYMKGDEKEAGPGPSTMASREAKGKGREKITSITKEGLVEAYAQYLNDSSAVPTKTTNAMTFGSRGVENRNRSREYAQEARYGYANGTSRSGRGARYR